MAFGYRLHQILGENRVNISKMCRKTGINYNTLRSIIQRDADINTVSIIIPYKIAEYTKMDFYYITGLPKLTPRLHKEDAPTPVTEIEDDSELLENPNLAVSQKFGLTLWTLSLLEEYAKGHINPDEDERRDLLLRMTNLTFKSGDQWYWLLAKAIYTPMFNSDKQSQEDKKNSYFLEAMHKLYRFYYDHRNKWHENMHRHGIIQNTEQEQEPE